MQVIVLDRFENVAVPVIRDEHFKEPDGGEGIPGGAVTVFNRDAESLAEVAQAVAAVSGQQFSAQPDRTEVITGKGEAQRAVLFPDKGIIELGVVGNHYRAFCHFHDILRHFEKAWRFRDHRIVDAGQSGDERRNPSLWIDQGNEFIHDAFTVVQVDGDLCNPVGVGVSTGRFNI